jgi:hypothetical protein
MPARSREPDPLRETPFWCTRGFRFGLLAAAVLAGAALTLYLVQLNQRRQMEWRVEHDPELRRVRDSLARQIAAAKPGQPRAPAALWLGRVRKFTVSQQTDGSATVSLLEVENAALLAGSRSRKDGGDLLTISGKQFTFGGAPPRTGETWLLTVWRDSEGNNVLHTAVRVDKK